MNEFELNVHHMQVSKKTRCVKKQTGQQNPAACHYYMQKQSKKRTLRNVYWHANNKRHFGKTNMLFNFAVKSGTITSQD